MAEARRPKSIEKLAAAIIEAVCLANPKQDSFDIRIVVLAGSQEMFIYSDAEISPVKNQIILSSGRNQGDDQGARLGDIEVILKPVAVDAEKRSMPGRRKRGYFMNGAMKSQGRNESCRKQCLAICF